LIVGAAANTTGSFSRWPISARASGWSSNWRSSVPAPRLAVKNPASSISL